MARPRLSTSAESPARLDPVSATFHGRDLFAPVAAHLALETPLAELGEPIDAAGLTRIDRGEPVVEAGRRLEAEVGHVDAFGNLSLVATAADADDAGIEPGRRLRVEGPRRTDQALFVLTFADADPGEVVLLVDSARSLALAVNRGDAARQLDLSPGERVLLTVIRRPVTEFGHPHLHLRETGSTNERARELAESGAPSGTVVTADEQSAGRGRRGRAWTAPPGKALLYSAILRPLELEHVLLPLSVPVAVCDAIEAVAPVRGPDQVAQRRLDRGGEGRRRADRGATTALGGDRNRRQRGDRGA